MATLLTQTQFSAPYGEDITSSRIYSHGGMDFIAGSYILGGLLPNWNNTSMILAPLQNASGSNVQIGKFTQPVPIIITDVTITGGTSVFACINPPAVGTYVTLSGFPPPAAQLNGITARVAAVTSTAFTCLITTTATSPGTTGGQAVVYQGPDTMWVESVAGSGFIYGYNKTTGLIQIFTGAAAQAGLTELAAGALPTGVVADVLEYEAQWVRA
jgi:hypothetical protein